MTTFLLQLRDAAKACSNKDYRAALVLAADEISGRVAVFNDRLTNPALQDLMGAWAHAQRLLKELPPEGAPAPRGGDTEAPLLQKVA